MSVVLYCILLFFTALETGGHFFCVAFSFRMKQEVKSIVRQTGRGKCKAIVSCSTNYP